MNRIITIFMFAVIFYSCSSPGKFDNDFKNGTFKLQIVDCEDSLPELNVPFLFNRNKNEIEIKYYGECLFEYYDYKITGDVKDNKDTLLLTINRSESLKNKYKDDNELAFHDCLCFQIAKFTFDYDISPKIPVKLNGIRVDTLIEGTYIHP